MIRADILAESIDADDGRPAWSCDEFEAQLRENGMRTMYEDGIVKALSGETTIEEVLRVTEEG